MMSGDGLHVVLGASGGLGSAVVRELVTRGRRVRGVTKSGRADVPEGVEMMMADVSRPMKAEEACGGAAVVYHCVNAPYADWPARFPPLTASILEGVSRAGAKLVFADNLYMYGPVSGAMTEALPYHAQGRKGITRARMAEDVMEAHASGSVRVTIGRASDFFGPGVTRSALGEQVFGNAVQGRPARMLGRLDVLHSHAFVEDFAWGLVTLGENDQALGEAWHVPTAEPMTAREFLDTLFSVLGTRVAVRTAGPGRVAILGVFRPLLREMKEMMYQFQEPFVVDHSKFERAFGSRVTPQREAIERTVEWFRRKGQ